MPNGRGQMRKLHLGEGGFTMIELLVSMVIIGALAAVGTSGWLSYQRSVEHRGSAQELVSALRNAQQASLSEAVTYCVAFDPAVRSYEVHKFVCGASGSGVEPAATTQSTRVKIETPAFVQINGSTTTTVSFFPRGSATKGSVKLTREGSDKDYIISVEGLTGRVSLTG